MGTTYEPGELLAEGKTKRILTIQGDDEQVLIDSKDDITAGDGAKHDTIAGKATLATTTTCNVFRLLRDALVSVAFHQQIGLTQFVAPRCRMIPLEVVVRREAHGSALKRLPHLQKGHVFPRLKYELFLKTSNRTFAGHDLVCDDPLLVVQPDSDGTLFNCYDPKQPLWDQKPFLTVAMGSILKKVGLSRDVDTPEDVLRPLREIEQVARRTFLVLEGAWRQVGLKARLLDFKIEFGLNHQNQLLVADVIDNDSWRVELAGEYLDKQRYRDGGELSDVETRYRQVAELTGRFHIPRQQIIIWRGSKSDDTSEITDTLNTYCRLPYLSREQATCSMHKMPEQGLAKIDQLIQQADQTVVIAFVGMSNGAGPTLAAHITAPVISIPANANEHPEDVWSSLRCPSAVPNLTTLKPSNAALAALQILAANNPALYANLRLEQEERLANYSPI